MKKEKLLYAVLTVLFIGYVVVEQYAPKPLDWTPTFSHLDKNPYGGYVLFNRLEDFFPDGNQVSFQTLYELRDSTGHVLILTMDFSPSTADVEAISEMLQAGRDVFIAAERFSEPFLDSLGLSQEINFELAEVIKPDSVKLEFDGGSAYFPSSIVQNRFSLLSDASLWSVHAEAEAPILVSQQIGSHQGQLVLSSTPLAFTNYGILHSDNYRFAGFAMRLISDGPVFFNRFYHSGRAEPRTPFRYLLSQDSLRRALYLTLFTLSVLLIIGSRRKQRVIPLLDPKENTTISYIRTIGGLYFREGNHKNVAEKIIHHFLHALSEKYYMSTFFTEASYRMLSAKTGLKTETVIETFDLIQNIRNSKRIPASMLHDIQQKITLFNLKK